MKIARTNLSQWLARAFAKNADVGAAAREIGISKREMVAILLGNEPKPKAAEKIAAFFNLPSLEHLGSRPGAKTRTGFTSTDEAEIEALRKDLASSDRAAATKPAKRPKSTAAAIIKASADPVMAKKMLDDAAEARAIGDELAIKATLANPTQGLRGLALKLERIATRLRKLSNS